MQQPRRALAVPVILATRPIVAADPTALVLDCCCCIARRGGAVWQFSPQAFRVLSVLAANQHRPLSIVDLVDMVYADDPEGGPYTAENLVRVYISKLRPSVRHLGLEIPAYRGPHKYWIADLPSERRAA